jgi:hypothetical protein
MLFIAFSFVSSIAYIRVVYCNMYIQYNYIYVSVRQRGRCITVAYRFMTGLRFKDCAPTSIYCVCTAKKHVRMLKFPMYCMNRRNKLLV